MAEVMDQESYQRDEVRVTTFNTMPLYFTCIDFEAEGEEFQPTHELHFMLWNALQHRNQKGGMIQIAPKMCSSSCHGNLIKSPPDDSQDTSPKICVTAGYFSQPFLKNPGQNPSPSWHHPSVQLPKVIIYHWRQKINNVSEVCADTNYFSSVFLFLGTLEFSFQADHITLSKPLLPWE